MTFSGDKLVGGPQAGLVVGRAELIARIRRDPLARAVRPDKTILAALAATLGLYRAGLATTRIPVWRMLAATPDELLVRAAGVLAALPEAIPDRVEIASMTSAIGGGSLPGETLPSVGLRVEGRPAAGAGRSTASGRPAGRRPGRGRRRLARPAHDRS